MTKHHEKIEAVNGNKHVAASALEGKSLSFGVNPAGVLSPVTVVGSNTGTLGMSLEKGFLTSAVCHRVMAGFAELQGIRSGVWKARDAPSPAEQGCLLWF